MEENQPWGYMLSIDLYKCDPDVIRDGNMIKQFVIDICDFIKMTRYGEPEVIRFGKDPKVSGYSLNQFIEESNITGHFIESTNSACIDIFSCLPFSVMGAVDFTAKFFKAEYVEHNYMLRGKHNFGHVK